MELRSHWWNRNYVGTHYGGSLYSMVDPFYMLMLIENLGGGYVVWDKSATIDFKRPGRGTVKASFRITEEQLDEIRGSLESAEKAEPTFRVEIVDSTGDVVAKAAKVLHIRKSARRVANL